MTILEQVIDKLELALLSDSDWGNNIFWGNFDHEQKASDDLPATEIFFPAEDTTNYSTVNSQRAFNFTVRGVFYNGSKIINKNDYLKYNAKNEQFKTLFETFLDNICTVTGGSAWLSSDRDAQFESIDERFHINQTFTIAIEELK